jgi:hypothetical protein
MPDHELRDLRRQLAALERGPGKRYPSELRRRIAGWARRAVADGATVSAVAGALGLHPATLRSWVAGEAPASMALVPVEVVAEGAEPGTGLHLVAPSGYRVERLSLDELVALLRVLG